MPRLWSARGRVLSCGEVTIPWVPATQPISPSSWASSLLHRLGIAQSPGAVQAIVGWTKAEGGHTNGARFNFLNTTQPEPGAGNTGSQGNIKVYSSVDQGLDATVKTLRNGRYDGILHALQVGDPAGVAHAIGASPWGTSGDLVRSTILGTPVVHGAKPIGGSAGSRPAAARPAAVAAPAESGGAALAALLSQQQAPVQQPRPSMGLAAPAFAAGPALPAGAQLAASAGVPRSPGSELATALSAIKALPGDAAPPAGVSAGAPPRTPAGAVAAAGAGADAAVEFARSRVGQYKESAGNNRGPQLDQLEARLGFKGAAWCAIFTSVAVTHGGAPKVARTASVAEVRQQAMSGKGGYVKGLQSSARPGDLILRGNEHIGLVESVDPDGTLHTIEGNTGAGQVARRAHAPGSVDIVRPRYAR